MSTPSFILQQGQERFTPDQELEAQAFARERIETHLSTEPADEQEAEAFLRQAYRAAQLAEPATIEWLDGPLQLVARFVSPRELPCQWPSVFASVGDVIVDDVRARAAKRVDAAVKPGLQTGVWNSVGARVIAGVRDPVGEMVRAQVREEVWESLRYSGFLTWPEVGVMVEITVGASVWAYVASPSLALYHFYDVYLAPNEARGLVHLNELVSGYWFGAETALLVRRPRLLLRDDLGRLHGATGKCLEYPDGWGLYAWHGVRVPEKVILTPDALTRADFENEESAEVRRVMEERAGGRFGSQEGDA